MTLIDHFTVVCLVARPLKESEASLSFKGQATKLTTIEVWHASNNNNWEQSWTPISQNTEY